MENIFTETPTSEKLTFYDIEKIFTELDDRKSSGFKFDDFFNDSGVKTEHDIFISNPELKPAVSRLGKFKLIETDDCEYEGYDTEKIWRVYHFTDHDVYVKVFGWWSSSSGCKFEKMKEVKPTTKTVTVYE